MTFSPEVQEILDRVRSGSKAPPGTRAPRRRQPTPTGLKRGENLSAVRPAPYDRQEIKRLYEEGSSAKEIADRLGAHRGTISRVLKDLGLTRRDPNYCKNGHEMSVYGRIAHGGGRFCRKCKTDREREKRQKAVAPPT